MGMDQYLLIPFLVGWTSINPSYDLGFTARYQGFDPSPNHDGHVMVPNCRKMSKADGLKMALALGITGRQRLLSAMCGARRELVDPGRPIPWPSKRALWYGPSLWFHPNKPCVLDLSGGCFIWGDFEMENLLVMVPTKIALGKPIIFQQPILLDHHPFGRWVKNSNGSHGCSNGPSCWDQSS